MHSGKVILITGGTGQVGTAAAAALRRGWKVRVLTRDSSSAKADALRTMGARMSSAAILTTGKACIGRWLAFFCVPPLVASFMPAGSFERQLAGSKNIMTMGGWNTTCPNYLRNYARPYRLSIGDSQQ